MIQPFFSIVIPTHNRPKLFQEALQSALLQDFGDFEVIVSNNSDDPDTAGVVDGYRNNPRLSVFRPSGNLSMPEHWEYATLKAQGRYVLVLTDRSVLKRHALKAIHASICSSNEEVFVCSWRWSLFNEDLGNEFSDIPVISDNATLSLSSESIIENFSSILMRYQYELPRGLNSCYRFDVANKIRKKYGALFFPLSPDFTSAFLLLSQVTNVLFLDSAFFISQGLKVSNGGNAARSAAVLEKYINTLNVRDCYAHVPIKRLLVENLIFEDFLNVAEMSGISLHGEVHWVKYFVTCYREICEKFYAEAVGSDEVKGLLDEWERMLRSFDESVQKEVRQRVPSLREIRFRKMFKASFLGSWLVNIRRARNKQEVVKRGKGIMEFAGFRR